MYQINYSGKMADCCKTHTLDEMKILDCPIKPAPDFLQVILKSINLKIRKHFCNSFKAKNPEMLADRQRRNFRHVVEIEAAKEQKDYLSYDQEFQERINKMNASKERQRRADEEFIKRKQVQQYM